MSLYVLVREQQLVGTGLDSKTYLTIKRYTRETSLRKIMDRALSAVQTPISKGEKIIPFWIYGYELPGQKQNVFGIFADVISTTANMHDKRVREQHDAWTAAAGPMKLRGDAVAFRLAACALSEMLQLELRWDEHFEKLLAEQDNFSHKPEPVIVEELPAASPYGSSGHGALRESIGTKIRTHLVPYELVIAAATGLNYGEEKYAARNWEKGFALLDLTHSVERHNKAIMDGEEIDEDSGLPHYVLLASSVAMMTASIMRGIIVDDRPEPSPRTVALSTVATQLMDTQRSALTKLRKDKGAKQPS